MAVTISTRTLESRYDGAASWWHEKIRELGYRSAYEDLVRRAFEGQVASSVADIGTGSGDLAASYCSIVGAPERLALIDSSAAMLSQAIATVTDAQTVPGKLDTIHSSLETLKADAQFELVLCAHVIEHCEDPQGALQSIAQHIEPGGKALLVVSRPHWCQWVIWLRWQHRWFSSSQVERMAQVAGLKVLRKFQPCFGPPSRTSMGYLVHKARRPQV